MGRGLAFDAEQNLYAAFDEVIGAELVASRLWVLAAPEREPYGRLWLPWLSGRG